MTDECSNFPPLLTQTAYIHVFYSLKASPAICVFSCGEPWALSSVGQWRGSYCTDFSEANSDLPLPIAFDVVFAAVILSGALRCSCPHLYLTFITELFSWWKPLKLYICKLSSSQLFSYILVLSCSLSGLLIVSQLGHVLSFLLQKSLLFFQTCSIPSTTLKGFNSV